MTGRSPEAQASAIATALKRRRPSQHWRALFVRGEMAFALYMAGAQVQVVARPWGSPNSGEPHYFPWTRLQDLSVDGAVDHILEEMRYDY